jgi:hypothetical protein
MVYIISGKERLLKKEPRLRLGIIYGWIKQDAINLKDFKELIAYVHQLEAEGR